MSDKIYLDFAATTPIRSEVLEAMLPFLTEKFGNPSSLHSYGQIALKGIDDARTTIQYLVGAESSKEIIFTASATEANNLIIKGIIGNYWFQFHQQPHLISSSIDHPSVIEVLKELEYLGLAQVSLVDPDRSGCIQWDSIKSVIRPNTILLSIHYVNSETGVIQSIPEISSRLRQLNQERFNEVKIIFHTDASQAPLTEPVNIRELGVDAMTLSSHKIYGPKGAALLCLKQGVELIRLISGSGQEFGLRAGTENIPAIVGFAKALALADMEREAIRKQLIHTRDYFLEKLRQTQIVFEINTDLENSSPKFLNLYFPQTDVQELLIYLDQQGIAVSAGMACQARAPLPNFVIQRQFQSIDRAKSSIRFSFGRETKTEEISRVVEALAKFFKD
jgi:cysteine desulfurase